MNVLTPVSQVFFDEIRFFESPVYLAFLEEYVGEEPLENFLQVYSGQTIQIGEQYFIPVEIVGLVIFDDGWYLLEVKI